MACPNPPSVDLVDFIRHIQNDVRWFVRAVGNYELWFGNDDAFPPNTIVAYLDSALLHGRTLVEFFGHTNSNHPHVRACHYLLSSFPCSNHQSAALRDWKKAANIKLAHLTANRDAGSISELIVTQVPQAVGVAGSDLITAFTQGLQVGLSQIGTGLGTGLKETGGGLGEGLNKLIVPVVIIGGAYLLLKNA